ncbi:enoyl-CoA hydratase [Thalassobaculum fulvum]|uniref:Enoyl-CoA hydratase n=1 Tax=Thalassobaculum fulvum TaxID=1633335 RepID=A0A918XVB1_9PROT|nr:enoyl-CoA hydratase-related protein [Thalassobaculum fulvum]GHD57624.1 enoyl-CoA hydratase [Thalassobaculum fulvum]
MTTYETLTVETDDRGVARVTLARPERHNALNDTMIAELRRAADALGNDDKVRVVVLTGTGKSFCAGGDITWFARNLERSRSEQIYESGELARMLLDLYSLPKALIGRINGPAYGGGVGMISVCDVAVGARGARFGLTEVRLGLIPANISPYVVKRIGVANSRATMLSGALFDADRAAAIGLLHEAVDPADLDARVEAVVADHLEAEPNAVADTKKLIDYVARHAIADSMIYTADRLADGWESEPGRTGVRCFLEKKLPPWRSGK